ncbi:MAG: TrkH family potassium uptake protein [Ruminococcaceae bacterium]|nr:TrkH family potassium uptake protein [Oscillospiraceae bacterium]
MNRKRVFYTIGKIIMAEATMLLLPLIVSFIYGESCSMDFIITIGIALAVGGLLMILFRTENRVIYAKEGFVIVAGAWIAMSLIGALPFYISGEIPSYIDAFFETVSGFTTTGASILTDVEAMSKGLLFWRSFTHWIGGMGVLVFVMAIIPNFSDRSIHLLRAEVPGPVVGKLVPRMKDTAKILYLIYVAMTVIEIILLLCGGMPFFDSVVHSFGTAGTGGFGIKADSIAGYSNYLQWVITIFMLLFGVNFNIYYLLLIRHFKSVFKSSEVWCYFGIVGTSIAVITANIYPIYQDIADSLRLSAFQVSSIITTTGFATADFDLWPRLSKVVLMLLMFVGACAGSTGGGLKVSRLMLLFKIIKKELKRMIHPRSVGAVKMEGKKVDEKMQNGVLVYFALYVVLFGIMFGLLCFESFDIETNFSAVTACFNNIGPGLSLVGPAANYSIYSSLSKIVLSGAMLLGRLEIFPLLLALSPAVWSKK